MCTLVNYCISDTPMTVRQSGNRRPSIRNYWVIAGGRSCERARARVYSHKSTTATRRAQWLPKDYNA